MIRTLLLCSLAVATAGATLNAQLMFRKQARVLTAAWASPEFEERRQTPDGPARMTYHFYEGKFHGGYTRDKSLANMSLQDIADTLARDMAEQNFHPADSVRGGDMVIVVHWGVTAVEESWADMFPDSDSDSETEFDEEGFEVATVDAEPSDIALTAEPSVASNAQLTGINKALNKKGLLPSEREEIKSLLQEERYFIVLMAYDWQKMIAGEERELLWTCRFSLPSPGTNFNSAVPSLSRAAAPMMGTNLEDLAKTKTQLGWGKGTVGDLEVIKELSEDELEEAKGE